MNITHSVICMKKLDDHEKNIVRELIRNPRVSDNAISKRTGIPVMTVNRKRKKLEEGKYIRYYASLDKGEFGMHMFGAKQMYLIIFKIGITRKMYLDMLESDPGWRRFNSQNISQIYLGEKDGRLALMLILDAVDDSHLVEEFNGKIVKYLNSKLGKDCIEEISTASLNKLVRVHHNYMPAFNMDKGIIKDDYPDELIFVDEVARDE